MFSPCSVFQALKQSLHRQGGAAGAQRDEPARTRCAIQVESFIVKLLKGWIARRVACLIFLPCLVRCLLYRPEAFPDVRVVEP